MDYYFLIYNVTCELDFHGNVKKVVSKQHFKCWWLNAKCMFDKIYAYSINTAFRTIHKRKSTEKN